MYELSKVLMACSLCQLNESTQVTMPYTLAVYMVTDFLGASASPAKISRMTGFLVRSQAYAAHCKLSFKKHQTTHVPCLECSFPMNTEASTCLLQGASFCSAQFGTSMLLGYFSDTYGRKVTTIPSAILLVALASNPFRCCAKNLAEMLLCSQY